MYNDGGGGGGDDDDDDDDSKNVNHVMMVQTMAMSDKFLQVLLLPC